MTYPSSGYRGPYVVFSLEEIRRIQGIMIETYGDSAIDDSIVEKCERALQYSADDKLRQPHK